MSKYIPYPFFYDDVPVDISFVFESEKPAGKHGFLTIKGRDFVFEDGTKVKFWGTNFNGHGNFPEKTYAEKLAKRLAKLGINLVRLHQLDSEWNTPNIFAFSKGKRMKDGSFDPESLDRLDYLIACLKKEGIYCYMDMFTYRKFRTDEGVENAAALPDAAKPYCMFNDRMIELQKDLCRRLWTHVNPYTSLAYCDDPVFVMAEIVNECVLFSKIMPIEVEPYRSEFLEKFDRWLKKNKYENKVSEFDLEDNKDPILADFKMELQEKYYHTMYDCMRECGVKIPIAGTNLATCPAQVKGELVTDFLDCHYYLYDFRWKEFEKHCFNKAITQHEDAFISRGIYASTADRPTYMSEWDMPWPNEYRAESPLYCAALGMFQGWSGFAIHTYSYSASLERMNMLGKEIFAEKIGNIPYRQGIFSAWNDPAKFGLFYHAALITRRGDVAPAKNVITMKPASSLDYDIDPKRILFEKSEIVIDFEEMKHGRKQENLGSALVEEVKQAGEILSDTGELYRSWKKNFGYINTPKTKCAYGFLCKNGEISLSGVSVTCTTDFAVLAMSSLTDEAICDSDNILLTAVGRAKNTDSKFEGDLMLDIGKPPVLIENIEAEITIDTKVTNLKVWAISPEGYYIGTVPASYEEGKFTFRIGEVSRSMYYLIVKD